MDLSDKLVNNIVSYFSETKLTEEFRQACMDELKSDPEFQKKLKEMSESEEGTPNDEFLWKKVIEADTNLLSQETKEKLYKRFEKVLQKVFQKTEPD